MGSEKLVRQIEIRTPETRGFARVGQITKIIPATERTHPRCMDAVLVPGAEWGGGDRYALASADPAGDFMRRQDLMTVRDGGSGKIYLHERPATLCGDDWLWVAEP